ncbi:magnesium transporter NIPA-domain-containing protein, partial [Chytridium lagenaria]
IFIGASVVFTKKGLIQSRSREVGREHAYLKNTLWWIGMVLMALGEIANFGAYAFTAAILVTPLGALSVVITAVLSSIFLNEHLNFPGKVGCAQCVIGATIIVLNAPESTTTQTIDEFFRYGLLCLRCSVLLFLFFLVTYCEKRYARKSPMVYISIASLLGPYLTLSTQGFGTSMVYSFRHWSDRERNQFLRWPIYPLFAFMVMTIIAQIHFLNRAYSLFSTAIVTPIFYVTFTTATLLGSAILYQGFPVESVTSGLSIVMGFLGDCGWCGIAVSIQYAGSGAGGGECCAFRSGCGGEYIASCFGGCVGKEFVEGRVIDGGGVGETGDAV